MDFLPFIQTQDRSQLHIYCADTQYEGVSTFPKMFTCSFKDLDALPQLKKKVRCCYSSLSLLPGVRLSNTLFCFVASNVTRLLFWRVAAELSCVVVLSQASGEAGSAVERNYQGRHPAGTPACPESKIKYRQKMSWVAVTKSVSERRAARCCWQRSLSISRSLYSCCN